MSATDHTSVAAPPIEAPVAVNPSSVIDDPMPAPCSTNTVWPAVVSSRTPAGVMATRYSSSLTSLGTPTIMGGLSLPDLGVGDGLGLEEVALGGEAGDDHQWDTQQ